MKKNLISIILVFAIITTALSGCGNTTTTQPNEESNSNTTTTSPILDPTEDEIDISIFPEVEASSENINVYREEVSKRFSSNKEDEFFISDEEWEAISNSFTDSKYWYNTFFTTFSNLNGTSYNYYYPVLFRDGDMLILWYTNESGNLLFEKLQGYGNIGGNYGGQLHHDTSDKEILANKTDYALTYTQETGKVEVWQFGTLVKDYSVPKNSIYCGLSYFEGYIFRNGTDVYSLKAENTRTNDGSVECIAHNVQYVIDADYYYGSDPWCQPLFIMTDGSIKCYIGWEGNQDVLDDPSHLCELQYEGSWDK